MVLSGNNGQIYLRIATETLVVFIVGFKQWKASFPDLDLGESLKDYVCDDSGQKCHGNEKSSSCVGSGRQELLKLEEELLKNF